jgi:hypothetical protein
LVLLKIKGRIIGRTFVQDYVFRPVECNQMSLYDWIELAEVEKLPQNFQQNYDDGSYDYDNDINEAHSDNENEIDSKDKDDKDTFYHFLNDHPLYHSHHLKLLKDIDGWVPNFVGGALPRSDRGDREYYCSTMLAFFKPWRTGKDLKSEGQNWDDAFKSYKFNTRQLEIMKYFNVRYECLDARDDYAAQIKKGGNIGIFSNWDVYDNLDSDIIDYNSFEGDNFAFDIDNINHDITGAKTEKRNKDMLHIEQIMLDAGWFDRSPNGLADVGDLTPLQKIGLLLFSVNDKN